MNDPDLKEDLHNYLRGARETLVWKLDGLDEYDIRRPLTPTGTNLLGLVKHSAASHFRYFGDVFSRTPDVPLPWLAHLAGPNAEFWAMPQESKADIVSAYQRTWKLADATIDELPLDAVGHVPWWGTEPVTLHRVLVHLTAETQRHAGHADILRELIDGAAGLLPGFDNLQIRDQPQRNAHYEAVEQAADHHRGG